MKRLTTYRADGRAAIANNENATPKQKVLKIPKVIDRLASFEETGLEPEEIIELKARMEGGWRSEHIEPNDCVGRKGKVLAIP